MGDKKRLRLLGLPVFQTASELARLIHIEDNIVWLFVRHAKKGHYYRVYTIKKRNGERRKISQPGSRLKAIQAWILRNVLDKLTPSMYSTAYRHDFNLWDNISPHVNNRFFLCLDIKDFFPSITFWRIKSLFQLVGYDNRASQILANLCTCRNALPQGGVTSPSLSNLVASPLDMRLGGYTSKRNISFTRYSDDMTFSANNPQKLCAALPTLLEIIKTEGFRINIKKKRLLGPRSQCKITGLVKNATKPEFGIGKKKRHQMRAIMYNYKVKNIVHEKYDSESSIEGWLNFLYYIDQASWRKMNQYWNMLPEKS